MFYAIQTKLLSLWSLMLPFLYTSSWHTMTTWCALGKAQLSGVHIHIGRFLSALLISLFTSLKAPLLDNFHLTVEPLRNELQ